MKRTVLILIVFLFFSHLAFAQSAIKNEEEIHWMSFQKAVDACNSSPKKIFIDMYTEWCGWCKQLDATTYKDKRIIQYINNHFYAVRMDAEMKDTVPFAGQLFINPEPLKQRSTHQLANALLNGKMSYPTLVYLDEKFSMLSQVPGYMKADELMGVLTFFGENYYSKMSWEEYQKLPKK